MTELFTVDGGIKPQFLTPIRNNLYRVLQKNNNFEINNRNGVDYVMTINNIPTINITVDGIDYSYSLDGVSIDCFDYIGGANY